jgi:hypothetical protein
MIIVVILCGIGVKLHFRLEMEPLSLGSANAKEMAMATKLKDGIVKQLRDERGWTQDDLAKKAGLNKQSIF